jgi:hypothetical protein
VSGVDLALVWPALVTPAIGLETSTEVANDYAGGVHAGLGVATLKRATVMGQAGVRFFTAALQSDGKTYGGTVADIELEIGERWGPGWSRNSEGENGIFWELGLGPHLVLMGGERLPLHVNPAIGAHTGFGGLVGKGDVRVLLGFRASATFRTDNYWFSIVGPTEDVRVDYNPGRVGIELLAGVHLP